MSLLFLLPPASPLLLLSRRYYSFYLFSGGKLQRQFKLFLGFWTPLLFQYVPCASKEQTRIRPLSHADEIWRGLMATLSCIPQDMGVPDVPDTFSCLQTASCHPIPFSSALATKDAPALPGLSWTPGHCARASAGLGSSSQGESSGQALPISCRDVCLHPDAGNTKQF